MSSTRRPARHTEAGLTLAEVLVATALFGIVTGGILFVFSWSSSTYHRGRDVIDSEEVARATLDYVVDSLRQMETGVWTADPIICSDCHIDDPGHKDGLVPGADLLPYDDDNPTRVMSPLVPEFSLELEDPLGTPPVEQVFPGTGNRITYTADLEDPPDSVENPQRHEMRTMFLEVDPSDPSGTYLLLREEVDHDWDGVAETTHDIAYNVRDLTFTTQDRPARKYYSFGEAESVSTIATCSPDGGTFPWSCHGYGSTPENLYGCGTFSVFPFFCPQRGSVWVNDHPDTYGFEGILIDLTVAVPSSGASGGTVERITRLRSFVRPRRLDL